MNEVGAFLQFCTLKPQSVHKEESELQYWAPLLTTKVSYKNASIVQLGDLVMLQILVHRVEGNRSYLHAL